MADYPRVQSSPLHSMLGWLRVVSVSTISCDFVGLWVFHVHNPMAIRWWAPGPEGETRRWFSDGGLIGIVQQLVR